MVVFRAWKRTNPESNVNSPPMRGLSIPLKPFESADAVSAETGDWSWPDALTG